MRREYEIHEQTDLIKQHAQRDHLDSRDWNDPTRGYSCDACHDSRQRGVVIDCNSRTQSERFLSRVLGINRTQNRLKVFNRL